MDFDIGELLAAASIIAPVVGGVWFAVRHFVSDLTAILKQYAERQAETLKLQHDVSDLIGKFHHLRGNHKQLSANVHVEFKGNDERFQNIEAQINRILGMLEGMNYGRRHDDD